MKWSIPLASNRVEKGVQRRLWLLLLPLLLILPGADGFPYPGTGARYSDFAISHFPNAYFLTASLTRWGSLPLWSPAIMSGYPFYANPLAGLWYLPGWLALLFPGVLGFNLLVGIHLAWGGLGMYRLMRVEGARRAAALLSGLAFALLPKLMAHYGAGHLTLLYAVPWTPWLLWAVKRDRPESGRIALLPGGILALIFLADVRWAAFAALLLWSYTLFGTRQEAQQTEAGRGGLHSLVSLGTQTIFAALLSAPLALPLLEFAGRSTRSAMTPEDVLVYSLPPSRLLGLIFPDFGGPHEWMIYSGALVLALALLAPVLSGARKKSGFWLAAGGMAILYSLGANLPGMAWLAGLPGFSLLRVPPRALFLLGLALAVLAGHALDAILSGRDPAGLRRGSLLVTALAGFSAVLAGGVFLLAGEAPLNFAWGATFWIAVAVWLILGLQNRLDREPWLAGLFLLLLLDLGPVDRSLFTFRPAEQALSEARPLARYLASQPGDFRIYSPSYSLPQQVAAVYDLQLADGVDPLQLDSYASFMTTATGVPRQGYFVSVPPFASGEPETDNAAYLPDPALLGWLNVRYVAAEYDLDVQGLEQVGLFGNTRLYENRVARPRAWLQPGEGLETGSISPVGELTWKPNEIVVEAPGSQDQDRWLVLAELDYTGWRVWIDGKPGEITPVAGLLRGVRLDGNPHRLVFRFLPVRLYLGLALSGAALLAAGVGKLMRKRSLDPGGSL